MSLAFLRGSALAMAAATAAMGGAPKTILKPTWTALYRFEKMGATVADSSKPATRAEAKHPAWVSGVTLTPDGAVGRAARIPLKSYLSIRDFPGGRGFTVAAWVRTTHTKTQYVLSKGNNGAGSFYLRLEDGGRLRGGLLPAYNMSVVVESTRSVNDGKWHHVAVTMDRRDMGLYIDGKPDRKLMLLVPFTACVPEYKLWTYVGAFDVREDDGEPSGSFFSGDMDEVRLTDAGATASQIAGWARRKP